MSRMGIGLRQRLTLSLDRRATTLGGIQLQLFSTPLLSAAAKPFVPASMRQQVTQDEPVEDEGSAEEKATAEAARTAEEAQRLAVETKAAIILQRRIRLRLKRQQDQSQHARSEFRSVARSAPSSSRPIRRAVHHLLAHLRVGWHLKSYHRARPNRRDHLLPRPPTLKAHQGRESCSEVLDVRISSPGGYRPHRHW